MRLWLHLPLLAWRGRLRGLAGERSIGDVGALGRVCSGDARKIRLAEQRSQVRLDGRRGGQAVAKRLGLAVGALAGARELKAGPERASKALLRLCELAARRAHIALAVAQHCDEVLLGPADGVELQAKRRGFGARLVTQGAQRIIALLQRCYLGTRCEQFARKPYRLQHAPLRGGRKGEGLHERLGREARLHIGGATARGRSSGSGEHGCIQLGFESFVLVEAARVRLGAKLEASTLALGPGLKACELYLHERKPLAKGVRVLALRAQRVGSFAVCDAQLLEL
jgi:hypothetical protein